MRRDVILRTRQNKIHKIYHSFLIKSDIDWMFLEISSIFRLNFRWNYITFGSPTDRQIGRETNFMAECGGNLRKSIREL
jgi:hypothetical protein